MLSHLTENVSLLVSIEFFGLLIALFCSIRLGSEIEKLSHFLASIVPF